MTIRRLYNDNSSDPKRNAQQALSGRSHYVDDATLKFHKSRVLYSSAEANGLLFCLITSDALDMNNTRRGFRYVVFDIMGNVVSRQELKDAFGTSKAALNALREYLKTVNALKVTKEAIKRDEKQTAYERKLLIEDIKKINKQ